MGHLVILVGAEVDDRPVERGVQRRQLIVAVTRQIAIWSLRGPFAFALPDRRDRENFVVGVIAGRRVALFGRGSAHGAGLCRRRWEQCRRQVVRPSAGAAPRNRSRRRPWRRCCCCCPGRSKGRLGRSCNRRRGCSGLKVFVHAEAVETFVRVRLELIDSGLAVNEGVSVTA